MLFIAQKQSKKKQMKRQKIIFTVFYMKLQTPCTDVRFASLLSGGFTTMAVVLHPPERKLANRTSVQ